jgi:hypothetical protein
MKGLFTCNIQEVQGRNEFCVSLVWGKREEEKIVKTLKDAFSVAYAFEAHCKRMFHSAQVVGAGRLD